MSLTIELSPFEKSQLDAAAERQGLPAAELARKLVTSHLPPDNGHATKEDPTLALFRKWEDEGPRALSKKLKKKMPSSSSF